MTTDLRELCYTSDSDSPDTSVSEIIEQCVDSDLSQVSQPASICDLDAEVRRLLDYHSSGSESNDESDHDTVPTNKTSTLKCVPQKDRSTSVQTTGSTASNVPKDLALSRIQSDQSSKSSPTGSLHGIPIASSYDSDEGMPKPLAEELEEVTVQEHLAAQQLAKSKQALSLFVESDDGSSSEYSSSEEIDFELRDCDLSPKKPLTVDKLEPQHPLLAVLTTATKQHGSSPYSNNSVHNRRDLEPKVTSAAVARNHTRNIPNAQKQKETIPPKGKGSTTRIQDQISHQNAPKLQSLNSNVSGTGEGVPSSVETQKKGNASQHTPQTVGGQNNPNATQNSVASTPPIKFTGKQVRDGRQRKQGGISNMEIQADSRLLDQYSDHKQCSPLPTSLTLETICIANDTVLSERCDKRSLNGPLTENTTKEVDRTQQPLSHLHLEGLIHTDSEASIASSVNEVLPIIDSPAKPAQVTIKCHDSFETTSTSCHSGSEGTGISTPVNEVSAAENFTPTNTIIHSPPCHSLSPRPKPPPVVKSRLPLKGILKNKSTKKSNAVEGDASSSNTMDVVSDKTVADNKTQRVQSTTSTLGFPQGRDQSLMSVSVPEQAKTSLHDGSSLSSTSSIDIDSDLDRTLTEDHRPNSSARNSSVVESCHPKSGLHSDQPTVIDHEATLVAGNNNNPLQKGFPSKERNKDSKEVCMQQTSGLQTQLISSSTHHEPKQQQSSIAHNTQPTPLLSSPLLFDELTYTDSEATNLSSHDGTPEHSSACLPSMPMYTSTHVKTAFKGNYSLVEKVNAVELRQLRMESMFAVEREALWDVILQQNKLIASLCMKGHFTERQHQAKLANTKRHVRLLERKLEDLEAGIVRIGRTAIDQQRNGAPGSLTEADLPGCEPWHRMGSLVSKKKLDKLTKFFGDTPPILQQFLKKLGYEEHIKKFENAGIGLPELPHTTEEQLKELGIPLGHRTRILQEAQNLTHK